MRTVIRPLTLAAALSAVVLVGCSRDEPPVFEELDLGADRGDGDGDGAGAASTEGDGPEDGGGPDEGGGDGVSGGDGPGDLGSGDAPDDPRAGGEAVEDDAAWQAYRDGSLARSGSPEAEIVADYRAAWGLVAEAHSSPSIAGTDDLSPLLTGSVLLEQLEFLASAADSGEATRGEIRLRPIVTRLEGDVAEVLDCYRSEGEVFDASDTVLRTFAAEVRYRVTMERDGGAWKQARLERLDGPC